MKALAEADKDETLDQLRQRLAVETSVSISRATMGRILQQLGLTRKKALHNPEAESPRVQQALVCPSLYRAR
ncbi:MAG: winged helix-turn-helix domain-containing protein [Nodosilinea sp.]